MPLMSTDEAVRAFYRDRLMNDAEVMRGWFAPDARIAINGSRRGGGMESCSIMPEKEMTDAERLGAYVDFVIGTWRLHDFEILSLATEGASAATRVIFDCECIANGLRVRTELCHFFVFEGELVTALTEFVDTALASRTLEGVEQSPSPYAGQMI